MPKTLILVTNAGQIRVDLAEMGNRTVGAVALPDTLPNPQHDNSLDTLTSMILAHACAGVDVESVDYCDGVNTTLDAIGNQDEGEDEDDMPLQLRQVIALESIVEALRVLTGTRVSRQLSLAAGIAASAVIADAKAERGQ